MGYEVRNHKLKGLRFQQQKRDDDMMIGPPPLGYPPSQQQVVTAVPYYSMAPTVAYAPPPPPSPSPQQQEQLQQALADVRRHGRNELVGEVGAAAAGAFALYELHEADVDPAHARRHKLEATVAGAVAAGSANYAYQEHKQKKKSEQLVEMLGGGGRNNLPAANHIKESLLTFASGHKQQDPKKEKLSFPQKGKLSFPQKEKLSFPQALPPRDQKKKQHLW